MPEETWLISRRMGSYQGDPFLPGTDDDSRKYLEDMGFTDIAVSDEHFYQVKPPSGWTKVLEGRWTRCYDDQKPARMRFEQLDLLEAVEERDREVVIFLDFPNPW